MTSLELVSVAASAGLVAGYHLWLASRVRAAPASTAYGQASLARAGWVRSVMTERRDILAVQTLRNWTMGASFLASTAVLVILGLLSIVLTSERLPTLIHNLNLLGSTAGTLITVKLLALVFCMLLAFVNFTVSIRYYNHVAFDINVPDTDPGAVPAATVCLKLDRAALHYTLGMRCYYFGLPIVLWLFGPLWMILGSAVLCAGLYRMDRANAVSERTS